MRKEPCFSPGFILFPSSPAFKGYPLELHRNTKWGVVGFVAPGCGIFNSNPVFIVGLVSQPVEYKTDILVHGYPPLRVHLSMFLFFLFSLLFLMCCAAIFDLLSAP